MSWGTDGSEAPTSTAGEIVVRGAVMWGDWGFPERTAEAVEGGWAHTGDTGTMTPMPTSRCWVDGESASRTTVMWRFPAVRESPIASSQCEPGRSDRHG